MASRGKALGSRSSLLSHVFPPFYACYLLRSIQTPLSRATYVGSTPNPPRRIRSSQHNGELKQGAFKTRSRRPWVMAMIVHGFPSRLAALQFEWAWQHPHKSRHLRDANGLALYESRRPRHLEANVHLVCQMISKHPYDTWPLHVKLFSKQAVVAWTEALRDAPPMPPGFTCSIELEGVDGKSGEAGTGRQESIDVKDEHFTSTYLSKNTALLATNSPLHCLVCKEEVMNYTTDALSTALCPSRSCTAVSHITCLSKKFLDSTSASTAFIPRGGTCPSCNTYILWGDIVRGSYRRVAGGVSAVDENILNLAEDELFASDSESCPTPQLLGKKTSKQRIKATTSGTRKSRAIAALSSEGELFDFDDTSTSSHELNATPKKRGRPSKAPLSSPLNQKRKPEAPISTNTPGQKGAPSSLHRIGDLSEGELFDSDLSSAEDAPQKRSQRSTLATTGSSLATTLKAGLGPMVPRERGRPPKVRPTENLPITAHTVSIKRSDPKTLAKKHYSTTTRPNSSSEFFDFETILRDDTVHVPEPSWHRHQETKSSEEPILGGDGDTIGLIHMMSSMSVSSPSPNHQPCYVEISD